jgi:hypothetical protein
MIKYIFFFILSNLLILTVLIDVIFVREECYILSLNTAKLELICIVELVDHCPIMTMWWSCGSSGQSKHRGVHNAHSTAINLHLRLA